MGAGIDRLLLGRFRDHTVRLFARHGMTSIGYWVPAEGPQEQLVYLLAFPDREAAEASWAAFRADPEVQEALVAARVAELAQPTLGDGETYKELLADRSAFEDYDIDRARTQGYGYARLQRLAIQQLLDIR